MTTQVPGEHRSPAHVALLAALDAAEGPASGHDLRRWIGEHMGLRIDWPAVTAALVELTRTGEVATMNQPDGKTPCRWVAAAPGRHA